MNNQTSILSDVELNGVSGGLNCAQAVATANVLISMGNILNAMGKSADAQNCYGKADGLVGGGCPG
jgi:hypothetical protein